MEINILNRMKQFEIEKSNLTLKKKTLPTLKRGKMMKKYLLNFSKRGKFQK